MMNPSYDFTGQVALVTGAGSAVRVCRSSNSLTFSIAITA